MFIRRLFREHSTFRENKRKRKAIVWLTVFILLAVSGAAGFILASNEPRVAKEAPAPSEVPAGADDSEIAKGASVEWEYEYRMCGHSVYLTSMADDNIVGLTFTQLQAKYPEARIVSFETEMVVLKVSFDCYCPRHYILKQNKGELAVFRTILGTDEQDIYKETLLKLDDISKDDQEILEAGKLFESLEELEYYLENISF